MPSLAEIIAAVDGWYPPHTAEPWDAVGLTCGDPGSAVDRVLLAVDCVPSTIDEAVATGAQLLLTHHPLLLSGVHSVATTTPKGAMVHRMIRSGVAHFVAHTNADVALNGVSDSLARALGLIELMPLAADPAPALDHLTVYVPPDHLSALIDSLVAAGAGAIGDYDSCTFTVQGVGTYRPLPGADPFDGEVGVLTSKTESRLSLSLPRTRRAEVLAAMRSAHPYEEIAFELTEQPQLEAATGSGRVGVLRRPTTLAGFVELAAAALPRTSWGIRAAGRPDRPVQRVAVCGGSGASYAEAARRAGADVYLTADLKHHNTLENVDELRAVDPQQEPMSLVDAAHWATEWPWLPNLATLLGDRFGDALAVQVSGLVTDPWTVHAHQ